MLAMNYRGPYRGRVDRKPVPVCEHVQDAVVRVTRTCICGSDLHLYHGMVPDTRVGLTFGHEFTDVVEEVGPGVTNLAVGDHVLVPFNIACGRCHFCKQGLFGNCHESNAQATAFGGIFGYSHTAGGYDGGQAEYVRVPYADGGPLRVAVRGRPGDRHRPCRVPARLRAAVLPRRGLQFPLPRGSRRLPEELSLIHI